MARRRDEDYDYLEDAFNDEKSASEMLEAQKSNNRSCLIALVVGVFGLVAVAIIAFGALSTLMVA